jgi:hypothetical protein
MAKTISNSYSMGITLSNTADNPVSVTGTIDVPSGSALMGLGGGGESWTIDNSGQINNSDASGGAIQLGDNGSPVAAGIVTNQTAGLIAGVAYGVQIVGPGTVSNLGGGIIQASQGFGVHVSDAGTISNDGTVTGRSAAVFEGAGGLITNDAGATLSSALIGVEIFGGTIVNDGTVTGADAAVLARSDGLISNAAGGTLSGGNRGVHAYGTETVTNAGLITGNHGVYMNTVRW